MLLLPLGTTAIAPALEGTLVLGLKPSSVDEALVGTDSLVLLVLLAILLLPAVLLLLATLLIATMLLLLLLTPALLPEAVSVGDDEGFSGGALEVPAAPDGAWVPSTAAAGGAFAEPPEELPEEVDDAVAVTVAVAMVSVALAPEVCTTTGLSGYSVAGRGEKVWNAVSLVRLANACCEDLETVARTAGLLAEDGGVEVSEAVSSVVDTGIDETVADAAVALMACDVSVTGATALVDAADEAAKAGPASLAWDVAVMAFVLLAASTEGDETRALDAALETVPRTPVLLVDTTTLVDRTADEVVEAGGVSITVASDDSTIGAAAALPGLCDEADETGTLDATLLDAEPAAAGLLADATSLVDAVPGEARKLAAAAFVICDVCTLGASVALLVANDLADERTTAFDDAAYADKLDVIIPADLNTAVTFEVSGSAEVPAACDDGAAAVDGRAALSSAPALVTVADAGAAAVVEDACDPACDEDVASDTADTVFLLATLPSLTTLAALSAAAAEVAAAPPVDAAADADAAPHLR